MADRTEVHDRDDALLSRRLMAWQWAGVALFALLVAAFPVYRAGESGRRAEALARREAALIATGRILWGANCASCHGTDGTSQEAGTPTLNAREFLDTATDPQIHHIVAAGIQGSEMPPWWVDFGGPLTDDQINAVVAYIRSWQPTAPSVPGWRNPEPEPTAEPSPADASPSPSPEPTPQASTIAVILDDTSCQPLEFDVEAGQAATLSIDNQGTGGFSFAIDAIGLHLHAPPGEVITTEILLNQEGDYQFECLGSGHGAILGVGVIHAQ